MTHLLKLRLDAKYLPNTFTLCVRWAPSPTKPRWVPPAKTKQFRVIPRAKELFPGENVEIQRLYNNYRCHLKGSLELLRTMYRESEVSKEVIDGQEKEKEDFWKEAVRINEKWNREVAVEREQLDRELFENEVREAEERIRRVNEERRKEQERIDGLIREQEALSKNFITPEKLDEHVKNILNSKPHSFNYALDLQGNVYDDFSPTPTRKVTEEGEFIPLVPEGSERKKVIRKSN